MPVCVLTTSNANVVWRKWFRLIGRGDWRRAKIVTYEAIPSALKRLGTPGGHEGLTGDNGDPDNLSRPCPCGKGEKTVPTLSLVLLFEDLIQPARATDDHNNYRTAARLLVMHVYDQVPALIVAHSTVYEPVRKEVKRHVVDPLGNTTSKNVSAE